MTKALALLAAFACLGGSGATPSGPSLTFQEKSRKASPQGEMINYSLRVGGLTTSKSYVLGGERMDGSRSEVAKGIRVDEAGRVFSDDGEELEIGLAQMFMGEFVVFTLVSDDGAEKVSGEITPFPIGAAGVGGCRLSVKPSSLQGDMFQIRGSGFKPGQDINLISTSSGEKMQMPVKNKGDGGVSIVVFPAVVGRSGGESTLTASDGACSVTVRYRWGDELTKSLPTAMAATPGAPTPPPQH